MDNPPPKLEFRWTRSRLWQGALLVLGLVAIILVLILSTPAQSSGEEGSLQSTEAPQSNPDNQMARSLNEKEAIKQRYEDAINQAQAAPPARGDRPPDMEVGADPEFQTGILVGVAGPFGSQDVVVSNVWQEELDEGFLQAFAGAYGVKPEQGVLVIIITSKDRLTAVEERFPTTEELGGLLIIQVEGELIELRAEDGTTLFFDLERLEYVQPG